MLRSWELLVRLFGFPKAILSLREAILVSPGPILESPGSDFRVSETDFEHFGERFWGLQETL